MEKGRIRILSQYFYPDVASTGQLLTELSLGLKHNDVSVSVITAKPSYAGKLNASKKEIFNSIHIRRVRTTRLNKNTKIGQVFNSISYFVRSFVYLLLSLDKTPLLLVSNPPFLPFLGYLIYKLRGIGYIILVHDVFPEKAIKLDYVSQKGFIVWLWTIIDKKSLKKASKIIAISETMKEFLLRKFSKYGFINKDNIIVIHNWADSNFIKPIEEENNIFIKENSLNGKFIVQYSGNIGASYELEILIEAARKMQDPQLLFLIIGDGVKKEKLCRMVKEYSLNNVVFIPYQKKSMLPYSLTASSVSIVTYEKAMEGMLMPSKLYTTLASGKAVISFCDEESEVGKIIRDAECGFAVGHSDLNKLIEKIYFLKSNPEFRCKMGINARKFFEKNFTLDHSLNKYIQVINEVQINKMKS